MISVTEADLEKAGYRLELWNGGSIRSWFKEATPDTRFFLRVEQEWYGGPFIPTLMIGRHGGSAIKLAGLDSLDELHRLYDLVIKGVSISGQALFEQMNHSAA